MSFYLEFHPLVMEKFNSILPIDKYIEFKLPAYMVTFAVLTLLLYVILV